MARVQRIAPTAYNLAVAAATVITASSSTSSMPPARLRNPTPTNRWRSLTGWTIITGFNDKLDFNRSGVKVATVAAGFYDVTGPALAAAVVAALEAADPTPVWAAAYDASTHKFTISSDIAFALLISSGANIATGIFKDMGYSGADTGSGTTQLAGAASYHSREYVLFDLGSAQAVTLGIAHDHNMGSGGAVTLYGKSAADPWASPGTTQALAGDDLGRKRVLAFGSQSYRYWALVLDDVQNAAGYVEFGVPFVGTYLQFGRSYEHGGAPRQAEPLSVPMRADQGAIYVLRKNAPKRHTVRYRWLTRAERDAYQAIEDAHQHVFLMKDAVDYPGSETVYGVIAESAPVDEHVVTQFSLDIVLAEDLG
jgi:hypothetical protein